MTLEELVAFTVSSYDAAKNTPKLRRWLYVLVAAAAAVVVATLISGAVRGIYTKQAEVRQRRRTVVELAKAARTEKNKQRKARLAREAIKLSKELDAIDEDLRQQESKLNDSRKQIDAAKDWKSLSGAMAD